MNLSWALAAEPVAMPAPEPARPAAAPQVSLGQCLVLAALLHAWLVALVGTEPGRSPEAGDGRWRAIQIRLVGPGPQDSPGRSEQPLPPTGPIGRAPEPRYGGAVRQAPPAPSPEPGAAQLGVWQPQPLPEPPRPSAAPATRAVDAVPSPPPPVLTRPDRQPESRPETPPAREAAPAAAAEPAPQASADAAGSRSTAPRLAPLDAVQAPVLDRSEAASREITHSGALPAVAAPPQAAPAPQREASMPAAVPAEKTPPQPERAVALPAPPVAPAAAPAPVPLVPSTPAPPARAAPEPVEVAPRPATTPRAAESDPATPAPPPPAAPPLPTPARVQPLTTQRPAEVTELPRSSLADLSTPPVQPVDGPAPAAAARPLSAPPPPALAGGGAPDAGARTGPDRALPPSAAASAPRLNLELPRARGNLPALVAPRVLNLVPPPPERKSALSEGIEKAGKADCRKAYSGMGALAVVPLAVDALRDGGCRW